MINDNLLFNELSEIAIGKRRSFIIVDDRESVDPLQNELLRVMHSGAI